MEKSVIHKLTIGIISIILSIIVIAVQINVIKTAIELERTPPVYLLQTYTVILAVAVISYLVYFSISQGVDVYRIIEEHKKYFNWRARTKAYKERKINYENKLATQIEKEKLTLKTLDLGGEPMNEPNPIDNTIEEYNRHKIQISKTNPIDLKFAPLEDKAKEVLDNLKQKRNVQE